MIKNDYLIAKLDQLAEVKAKILELNEEGLFEEAHQEVRLALKQIIGLSPELAESLSYKDLINFIGAYEAAQAVKYMILAELLRQDALIFRLQGMSNISFNLNVKSFNIFAEAVLLDSETSLERYQKEIEEVAEAISKYHVPYETGVLMLRYYEISGRYDKAEDVLYDLEDSLDNDDEANSLEDSESKSRYKGSLKGEASSFYKRLLQMSDSELEKGNFSLEEAREGLDKWE